MPSFEYSWPKVIFCSIRAIVLYGQPDHNLFPTAQWRECCKKSLSAMSIQNWAQDTISQDDPEIIHAIQKNVLPARGILAHADEIIMTVGAQHALYLLANLLFDKKTRVAIEDPGYPDARNIFSQNTRKIYPLRVDQEGIVLEPELQQCDYVFVTPSHQCPSGSTMSIQRRLALLEAARIHDIMIIEDDYDIENSLTGTPIPSLKSLDEEARVIYIGSLSKSFAPGLRLGYIVAHPCLIKELRALRRLMLRHVPTFIQRTFALFISLGHYSAFLRKQSLILQHRAEVLHQAIQQHLPNCTVLSPAEHTCIWLQLPHNINCQELAQAALKQGIVIEPGDVFFLRQTTQSARYIRLGFGSIDANRINEGIYQLAQVIQSLNH